MILVRLRSLGPIFSYSASEIQLKEGDYVIVEHDRGVDYGVVISPNEAVAANKSKEPLKKILRVAADNDIKQIEDNRVKAKDAAVTCGSKIQEHKLEMKLVYGEYSFDKTKIVFYFTANGRVDFRELVKDLAKIFKARIELRQIGVRDEARFFGGFGPCGRELCCAKFLRDFEPVTIKMAKEEGLPLNPPKISGLCGRLMCCLNFEYDVYKNLSRGLPKEGEHLNLPQGKGKVLNVNVFKRSASVQLEDGSIIQVDYNKSP